MVHILGNAVDMLQSCSEKAIVFLVWGLVYGVLVAATWMGQWLT